MRYISLFSGIEAASIAWMGLDWEPVAFSEIEKFPSAVLADRWPNVPNLGDITKVDWSSFRGQADLVVGGSPCQAFSVAGLRKSLGDERGNLTLEYVRTIHAIRPKWFVWENVPGVLSTKDNAFGCFLAGLAGADAPLTPGGKGKWDGAGLVVGKEYAMAWRMLDAQFFGVPQRRRRIFVVGHLGGWEAPAQVLFESEGLLGNPSARRKKRQEVAGTLDARTRGGGFPGSDGAALGHVVPQPLNDVAGVSHALTAQTSSSGRLDATMQDFVGHQRENVTHTLKGEGFDASEDGTGRGVPLTIAFKDDVTPKAQEDLAFTLTQPSPSGGGHPQMIAFSSKDHGADAGETCPTLRAGGHDKSHANAGVPPAVCFQQNTRDEVRLIGGDGKTAGAVIAEPGMHGQNFIAIGVVSCQRCGEPIRSLDEVEDCCQPGVVYGLRTDQGGANGTPVTEEVSKSIDCGNPPAVAIPFDTTQITSPLNYSKPGPGDPCHPLASGAHPPAIAFGPLDSDPTANEENSPTVRASGRGQSNVAVAKVEDGTMSLQTRGSNVGVEKDMTGTIGSNADRASGSAPIVFEPRFVRNDRRAPDTVVPPLKAQSGQTGKGDAAPVVAFKESQSGTRLGDVHSTLDANKGSRRQEGVVSGMIVRRLTPRECERLQGFPDDYTLIPSYTSKVKEDELVEIAEYLGCSVEHLRDEGMTADGPRYKALGNSMAVPCMRRIGHRIKAVDANGKGL